MTKNICAIVAKIFGEHYMPRAETHNNQSTNSRFFSPFNSVENAADRALDIVRPAAVMTAARRVLTNPSTDRNSSTASQYVAEAIGSATFGERLLLATLFAGQALINSGVAALDFAGSVLTTAVSHAADHFFSEENTSNNNQLPTAR